MELISPEKARQKRLNEETEAFFLQQERMAREQQERIELEDRLRRERLQKMAAEGSPSKVPDVPKVVEDEKNSKKNVVVSDEEMKKRREEITKRVEEYRESMKKKEEEEEQRKVKQVTVTVATSQATMTTTTTTTTTASVASKKKYKKKGKSKKGGKSNNNNKMKQKKSSAPSVKASVAPEVPHESKQEATSSEDVVGGEVEDDFFVDQQQQQEVVDPRTGSELDYPRVAQPYRAGYLRVYMDDASREWVRCWCVLTHGELLVFLSGRTEGLVLKVSMHRCVRQPRLVKREEERGVSLGMIILLQRYRGSGMEPFHVMLANDDDDDDQDEEEGGGDDDHNQDNNNNTIAQWHEAIVKEWNETKRRKVRRTAPPVEDLRTFLVSLGLERHYKKLRNYGCSSISDLKLMEKSDFEQVGMRPIEYLKLKRELWASDNKE